MKRTSYLHAVVVGATLSAGFAGAAEPTTGVEPAGGIKHKGAGPLWPPAKRPSTAPCPVPCPPSTMPKDPMAKDPEMMPPLPPAPDLQATQAGTAAEGTNFPTVFGDLLGGGGFAGPLPVRVGPNGQFIGPAPVVILPNGQRQTLGNPGGQMVPSDELIAGRPATLPAGSNPPGTTTVALFPPEGAVFAPEFAAFVTRIPQVTRGAFKIAENDTPRPTTRFYATYNYYDQVFKGFGGPDTPRFTVHQEMIGYEQAFAENLFSVALRLPYNQIQSPGFFSNTSLGDLTLITKAVLWENTRTGNLLSGGLVFTFPTADSPFASTITGEDVRPTLIQPYVGYIWGRDDFFLQGFSSIVIPTDDRDVTFLSNDIALGYYLYRAPGRALSGIIPVMEMHLNTPLNHRGAQTEPVGFVDQFTVLGGAHFFMYDRSSIGFAAGAPLTGPRPFSLQATVQLNIRF